MSYSTAGLFLAAALFLVSTSPSLLPRTWYYQGLVSGICAATGYALGVLMAWAGQRLARLLDLSVSIGRTAGRVLRRAAYVVAAVAVVVITTEAAEADRQRALKLGADDYIAKPIQASQLVACVREQLSRRHRDGGTGGA